MLLRVSNAPEGVQCSRGCSMLLRVFNAPNHRAAGKLENLDNGPAYAKLSCYMLIQCNIKMDGEHNIPHGNPFMEGYNNSYCMYLSGPGTRKISSFRS